MKNLKAYGERVYISDKIYAMLVHLDRSPSNSTTSHHVRRLNEELQLYIEPIEEQIKRELI
jgi:hypothetical protein